MRKNLSEMASNFGIVKSSQHCWVIVAKGQTGDLSKGVQNDVAVGIENVISGAFVEIDDDLSSANVLHLIQLFHRLSSQRSGPRGRDTLRRIWLVVLSFGGRVVLGPRRKAACCGHKCPANHK